MLTALHYAFFYVNKPFEFNYNLIFIAIASTIARGRKGKKVLPWEDITKGRIVKELNKGKNCTKATGKTENIFCILGKGRKVIPW